MTTSPHFAPQPGMDLAPVRRSPTRGANWAGRGREAQPMTTRDHLAQVLHPDLLDRLDAYINERVSRAVNDLQQTNGHSRWVTLEDAAALDGCTPDAMRMRSPAAATGHAETEPASTSSAPSRPRP